MGEGKEWVEEGGGRVERRRNQGGGWHCWSSVLLDLERIAGGKSPLSLRRSLIAVLVV